jgi:hypothetical protein
MSLSIFFQKHAAMTCDGSSNAPRQRKVQLIDNKAFFDKIGRRIYLILFGARERTDTAREAFHKVI